MQRKRLKQQRPFIIEISLSLQFSVVDYLAFCFVEPRRYSVTTLQGRCAVLGLILEKQA